MQTATRFAVFGKAVGMFVASVWEVRPSDLCETCLRERFRTWTRVTAVLGWWGAHAFAHALCYIPANIVEFRRATRAPATPAEPTEEEALDALALRTRVLLLRHAAGRVANGSAAVLVAVLILAAVIAWLSEDWSVVSTFWAVAGATLLAIGAVMLAAGLRRRRDYSGLPREALLEIAATAPPPAPPARAERRS